MFLVILFEKERFKNAFKCVCVSVLAILITKTPLCLYITLITQTDTSRRVFTLSLFHTLKLQDLCRIYQSFKHFILYNNHHIRNKKKERARQQLIKST